VTDPGPRRPKNTPDPRNFRKSLEIPGCRNELPAVRLRSAWSGPSVFSAQNAVPDLGGEASHAASSTWSSPDFWAEKPWEFALDRPRKLGYGLGGAATREGRKRRPLVPTFDLIQLWVDMGREEPRMLAPAGRPRWATPQLGRNATQVGFSEPCSCPGRPGRPPQATDA
jgi:hypothetical protein